MAYDLCRPLKLESPQEGGTQLDIGPTELNPLQDAMPTAGVYLQNSQATAVDRAVLLDRTSGSLRMTDTVTSHVLGELVSSTSSQVGSHNALLDLIHFLHEGPGDGWASGSTCVESRSGPLLTSSVWYTDNTLAKKIVGTVFTYTGPLVATVKTTLYAADGSTVAKIALDTYAYSGALRTGVTRTFPSS